jgi:hypothetical protein
MGLRTDGLLEEVLLSLGPARKVFSMPPLLSGLGVREVWRGAVGNRGASVVGGRWVVDVVCVGGASTAELDLEV